MYCVAQMKTLKFSLHNTCIFFLHYSTCTLVHHLRLDIGTLNDSSSCCVSPPGTHPEVETGCLTPTKRAPLGGGGLVQEKSLTSRSEARRSGEAWHQLSDLPAQQAPCVDAQMHTSSNTPFSSADSGVLGVTLLNFSPSFSSLLLLLSWQELLAPLPPAITLLLSLPYSHPFNPSLPIPAPPCFPLFSLSRSFCSFTLVKFWTSNPPFFSSYCTWTALVSLPLFFSFTHLLTPPNSHLSSPCWSSQFGPPAGPTQTLSLRLPLCSCNSALICLLLLLHLFLLFWARTWAPLSEWVCVCVFGCTFNPTFLFQ